MSWEIDTLGTYSKVISGYAFKSDSFRTDNGIPIIKIKNIQREYVEIDGEYFVDTSFLSLDPKFHCIKNDILISLTGSHITLPNSVVGRVAKYHYDFTSHLNQRGGKIVVTNPDKLENNYLYYYLCQNEIRIKLAQFGRGGANQCNISPSNVESIPIILPPLETQKRIASILSTYDDLIENNLKRIKLLEETAQNIYKEWFVNFRFPNYEHTEFDAESGLPVGWQKINLYDFVEIKMGFPFKGEDFNEVNIGKPAIRIRDIPSSWTRTHTTQEVSEEYIVEQGDILIGMDGFFYLDIWRGQKGYLVQRVCRIRANEQNLQGFLLESLRQPISYYEKTISGATVAHLGAKHLKEIFINVPKDSQLLEELKVFNRLNSQKINLSNQNQKLKEARDILLPRLMNRTIEV